jgi:hypothetical protein
MSTALVPSLHALVFDALVRLGDTPARVASSLIANKRNYFDLGKRGDATSCPLAMYVSDLVPLFIRNNEGELEFVDVVMGREIAYVGNTSLVLPWSCEAFVRMFDAGLI